MTGDSVSRLAIVLGALAGLSALSACGRKDAPETPPQAGERAMLQDLALGARVDAAGTFIDPKGATLGHVVFQQGAGGVLMRLDIRGLTPGWHAIHFHRTGDCSDGAEGFQASGPHVDQDGHEHGLLNPEGSERGDFPNIYATPDGRVTVELFRWGVGLYPSEANAAEFGPFPLLDEDGFAVVIHENPDDHMTQPIGGAGARVACAAITG
jgi:Cu-Zn family superoxide dismutase